MRKEAVTLASCYVLTEAIYHPFFDNLTLLLLWTVQSCQKPSPWPCYGEVLVFDSGSLHDGFGETSLQSVGEWISEGCQVYDFPAGNGL